ncbi:hypothetical protein PHYPSEUDO_009896 [Phytophthora pseudosyringae]|uniref:Uncharacterized protein n=1 Tax=Phytophthora pseudosyringae TaxID=221518 RepID=A0A8T1VEP9_9STRA|nr:hypothetical protein PHYPSEUDO_009896 [Phytophthora pseudosyringae]
MLYKEFAGEVKNRSVLVIACEVCKLVLSLLSSGALRRVVKTWSLHDFGPARLHLRRAERAHPDRVPAPAVHPVQPHQPDRYDWLGQQGSQRRLEWPSARPSLAPCLLLHQPLVASSYQ